MKESWRPPYEKKIDQPNENGKPFDYAEKPSKKEELSEEIKLYQTEGQKMLDSYRRFFMTFAKDVSLEFKLSDKFCIELENGVVHMDTRWFAEKGCTQNQILWANLHELSHFRDLADDPEGMMKGFEYIGKMAKQTGAEIMKKWEEKFGASDPDLIAKMKTQKPISKKDPAKTMNAVEMSAYKIHHTFYNIFDDIYVNNLISERSANFQKGEGAGAEEIKRLYREKLFAKTDYSELPRHLQFVYKLIREEMVSDESAQVSDEVLEVMQTEVLLQGKKYTPAEIVQSFLKPKRGRDTKASQRYFVLQKTLEPIFNELLLKDLNEWDPQKPKQQKEEKGEGESGGSANPFDEAYDEFDKNNPDQISDEDIRNWMDKDQDDKKKAADKKVEQQADEGKSSKDKAEIAQGNMDKNWCEKNNVDWNVFRQFKKIESEVEPYLEDLSRLWQKIIFGTSKNIERGKEGYFRTGLELDVQKVIEEWPKISEKKFEDVRVMKRDVFREVLEKKPELIRIRLVGDMSGSMDREKIHVLQQCFVLLLSSLREFNTYLNLTRSQTKSKLEADSEAWIFGDKAVKVKKLRSESGYEEEQIEMVKVFEKLRNTIGSTYDNEPLEAILDSVTEDDRKKIEQGKILEIVFEITDGGSSAPVEVRTAIDALGQMGIITRAFQIGEVSAEEKNTFNAVWNKNREESQGEIVGESIENLLPAVATVLKKYLSGVKL